MKKGMMTASAVLFMAGAANAALVTGYGQRYQADDYNTGTGVWADSVSSSQDATAVGTFETTTTANGSTAVVNTGSGQEMLFTRDSDIAGTGFTIQMVIRLDSAGTDSRQGPFALDEASGWSGLYMGANAGSTSQIRAGRQDSSVSGTYLLSGSAGNSVDTGTWGIYTLVVDPNASTQMTATFDLLSDGSTAFSITDSNDSNTEDIYGLSTSGRLFGGDMGGSANGDTDEWLGAIADVVVYDSVLTSTELASNEAEFQTLYQIPEPATLGMIGAFGGAMLFIRRRFMI